MKRERRGGGREGVSEREREREHSFNECTYYKECIGQNHTR